MSLKTIRIENCKSIQSCKIELNQINCFIGENGVGKTNIIKAIEYFYSNLVNRKIDFEIEDRANPFNDYLEITLEFDFAPFKEIIEEAKGILMNSWLFEEDPNEFVMNIYHLASYSRDDILPVTVRKYKNGKIKWTPDLTYDLRVALRSLFPMYFVKTRDINLTDWKNLWSFMGDLSKLSSKDYDDELKNFFTTTYGSKFENTLSLLKKVLTNSEIELNKFIRQEKFVKVLQLQLGGDQFKHKSQDLGLFSDGTNSYNFLATLGLIVGELSKERLKSPLIIVDEPEIGLHPQYIDKLIQCFLYSTDDYKVGTPKVIFSTHSTRVLKNMLQCSENLNIFHLTNDESYTLFKKMNIENLTEKERNRFTDEAASCFFSKGIVMVEGQTEIELFSNKNILNTFEYLGNIDFYTFDGDSVKLSLLNPKDRDINVPHLILVDLDQIVEFNGSKLKICEHNKDHLNPLYDQQVKEKEKYNYGKRRRDTVVIRKRIEGLITTCNFHISSPWQYVHGTYFNLIKDLIRKYCNEYNVYPVDTTIEGVLVNRNNYREFFDFLMKENPSRSRHIQNLFDYVEDPHYRMTVLRLIVDGKFDTLKKRNNKVINSNLSIDEKRIFETINRLGKLYEKTSGWLNRWIDYIFSEYILVEEDISKRKSIFRMYFPELYDIIIEVNKMINKKR